MKVKKSLKKGQKNGKKWINIEKRLEFINIREIEGFTQQLPSIFCNFQKIFVKNSENFMKK